MLHNLLIVIGMTLIVLSFAAYAAGQYYVKYCLLPATAEAPRWARIFLAIELGRRQRDDDSYQGFLLQQAAVGFLAALVLIVFLILMLTGRISNT